MSEEQPKYRPGQVVAGMRTPDGQIVPTVMRASEWSSKFDELPKEVQADAGGWSSSYYELPEDARELQDLIEYRGMNFAVGNIFKAAYRLGQKPGADMEYDLHKIIWFAQRELSRIRKVKGEDAR